MNPPAPAPPPLIERLIEASARNRFLVCVLLLIALSGGWWALRQTPLDAIPDLSDTQVIIYTTWEGRSPDLVEDQITYPISARFISAPDVKFVRGESMFGKSFVYVIFKDGTDLYWARSRVLEYLNSVRASLPAGVNPTLGPDATGVGWVYEYALVDDSGRHSLADLRSFQDWHLRYALESVPGVAEVASVGGFVRQYQVDLDPAKLLAYGIPIGEVADRIRHSNSDVGGRTFEIGSTEYYIRGRGYIKSLADIEDIPVKTVHGTPVLVKNLGTVHLGPDLRRGVAELDGKGEVVGGIVIMRSGENALAVIDGVKAKLRELAPSLPAGVKIVPVYDRSVLINRAVTTLRDKLIEESLVVAGVCLLFLWHVRSALVAIITLPAAILLMFLPMLGLGLSSNIMSLGGIAIAIGAMVDSAIVMIEHAHKELERFRDENRREPTAAERVETVIAAARGVGRALFFSLLVITISFLPIFTLTGEEGRLFKPLAFTKTFSMGFAALLGVTLVPVLMVWLIRGRITTEARNPVNRVLIWIYRPCVGFVLRHRWLVLALAAVVLAATVWPFRRLGSEFMPPLNEGTILFMPTAVPGMSVTEATKILQMQDRLLRSFPEVEHVFGKAGGAETATDPAPLSMFETVVTLKPPEQWPPGMTWQKLVAAMNEKLKTPGMANIFWMPIQTRTEMLTTGFRTAVGLKVFGPDLAGIQRVAVQIEKNLTGLTGTRSVFAERPVGGYYLDFTVNRAAAARYGLTVDDVNGVIESALGGQTVTTTIEGRERYGVAVRYGRDFRDNLDALKRVLVPTPAGAQVPISALADLHFTTGAPSIRSENGQLVGFVFVDLSTSDIAGYVKAANARLHATVQFPPGYYVQWAGQYQYLQEAEHRLAIVIPFTLLLIFLLLYLNTRSLPRTVIVLLAVPFSLVGAFWLLWLLHYNLSVAVWVGLIALAGLDAETGVVMLLYLDHAWERHRAAGRLRTPADLHDVVMEGTVERIRPKIMTVCAILFGLLPILWAPLTETGADVMKRIAAPMVGGVITSAILELLLYPAIYSLWRRRHLPPTAPADLAHPPAAPAPKPTRKTRRLRWLIPLLVLGGAAAGYHFWRPASAPASAAAPAALGQPFATQTVNGLRVDFYSSAGGLSAGNNEFALVFRDAATGQPVDAGAVTFSLGMNMPGMVMQSAGTVTPAGQPGFYRVQLKPGMSGDWTARLHYRGQRGEGDLSFTLHVGS